MSSMTDLQLDWCSHKAANFACENWHYSECMPIGKTVKIGVWEREEYIGCIIYSRGANAHIAEPYNMSQTEVCELTRVALADHDTPVTRMLSISRKLLKEKCPGVKLIISYADPIQDHHGGIYQGDNWYYTGTSSPQKDIYVNGEEMHKNSVHHKYGTASVQKLNKKYDNVDFEYTSEKFKYKYVKPLTDRVEQKVKAMAKPYP